MNQDKKAVWTPIAKTLQERGVPFLPLGGQNCFPVEVIGSNAPALNDDQF